MSEDLRDDPVVVRQTRRWTWVGTFMLRSWSWRSLSTRRSSPLGAPTRFRSQDAALIASGAQLWGLNCAACHGLNGQGVSAPALNSQEFFQGTTDEQIAGIIRGGVPGTAMPAWWNEYGGPLDRPTDHRGRGVHPLVGEDRAELSRLANAVVPGGREERQ